MSASSFIDLQQSNDTNSLFNGSTDSELSSNTTSSTTTPSQLFSPSIPPSSSSPTQPTELNSDPLIPSNPDWTIQHDIQMLSSIAVHRPVGPHKHFRILCIQANMERTLNRHTQGINVPVDSIWTRLNELYDLELLDKTNKNNDDWPGNETPNSSAVSSSNTSPMVHHKQMEASAYLTCVMDSNHSSRRSQRLQSSLPTSPNTSDVGGLVWDPTEVFSLPLEWLPTSALSNISNNAESFNLRPGSNRRNKSTASSPTHRTGSTKRPNPNSNSKDELRIVVVDDDDGSRGTTKKRLGRPPRRNTPVTSPTSPTPTRPRRTRTSQLDSATPSTAPVSPNSTTTLLATPSKRRKRSVSPQPGLGSDPLEDDHVVRKPLKRAKHSSVIKIDDESSNAA